MEAEQTAVEAATQAGSDGGKGKAKDAPRDKSKETSVLLEFLFRLAQSYLGSGEQTAQVELLIRRIATAYGMRRVRVVAFPTAIFISVDDGTGERVTLAEGPVSSLRLDQISDIYTLGSSVQRKELTPGQGLEQLNRIMRKAPRFGLVGTICGHTILSFGLAMLLLPSLGNILLATLLGTFVGSLKAMRRSNEVLAVPLSVVASFLVSAVVFGLAKYGLPIDPLQSLIPALVTFLPGAMLAMGMVELAYGDMVSGASRLINGFIQLVLLATFAAQRGSSGVFGTEFSGFFGALVATPLVYLIQLRFKGPARDGDVPAQLLAAGAGGDGAAQRQAHDQRPQCGSGGPLRGRVHLCRHRPWDADGRGAVPLADRNLLQVGAADREGAATPQPAQRGGGREGGGEAGGRRRAGGGCAIRHRCRQPASGH